MSNASALLWQHPWYLLTALAVLIPLVIHLLNKSRGRLVHFAYIALLRQSAPQTSTELRLNQRLLLLLRMVILLLASMLIAAPFWFASEQSESQILVSADWLNRSSETEKNTLIARLADEQLKPTAILLDSPASAMARQNLTANDVASWQAEALSPLNLWAKVHSHSQALPANTPLIVYASNGINQVKGRKVPLSNPLEWQLKDLTDAVMAKQPFKLSVLVVYDQDRKPDLPYIKAAIKALQQNPKLQIEVQLLAYASYAETLQNSATNHNLPSFSAALWLSSSPLPASLLKRISANGTLLLDAPQSDIQGEWHITKNPSLLTGFSGQRLSRLANTGFEEEAGQNLIYSNAAQGSPHWVTNDGQNLLRYSQQADVRVIQFYSRFNPKWSTWPLQSSFALMLGKLLFSPLLDASLDNSRTVAYEQIRSAAWQADKMLENSPSTAKKTRDYASPAPHSEQSLSDLLAILLVIMFCAERVLSESHLSGRGKKPVAADPTGVNKP